MWPLLLYQLMRMYREIYVIDERWEKQMVKSCSHTKRSSCVGAATDAVTNAAVVVVSESFFCRRVSWDTEFISWKTIQRVCGNCIATIYIVSVQTQTIAPQCLMLSLFFSALITSFRSHSLLSLVIISRNNMEFSGFYAWSEWWSDENQRKKRHIATHFLTVAQVKNERFRDYYTFIWPISESSAVINTHA